MGGVMGKAALVAAGALIGATAVEFGQKLAREAAEAVFEAITEAAEAAFHYMSALHRAVSSAAAEAYEEVERVVAKACDAVKRAAAGVVNSICRLIEHVHGFMAANFAKMKLESVIGLFDADNVASLVSAIVDGIKRSSLPIFPEQPFGLFSPAESPKGRRAAASTAQIMKLLAQLSAAVGEMFGLKVPTAAKVAISVIGVVPQLVFTLLGLF